MAQLKRILVPTDFSPHARAALRLAAELAQKTGAALCLLHAYELIPYVLPEGMPMFDPTLIARLRDELGQQLSLARDEAKTSGVTEVETRLTEGNAAREIVRTAESWKADLVVMGTHGRTGIEHLLLGSVAEKVVRKAGCPVITVPLKPALPTP